MEYDIYFRGRIRTVEPIPYFLQREIETIELTPILTQNAPVRRSVFLPLLQVPIAARIHNVGRTDAVCDVKFYIDQKIPENLIASFPGLRVPGFGENWVSTAWEIPENFYGDHALRVVIENCFPGDDDPLNNEASRTASLPFRMEEGDIAVASDDITFSDDEPTEGQKIEIRVNVHNTGVIDVENVGVVLYVDNVQTATGTVPFIKQNSENSISIEWTAELGDHTVGVYVSLEEVDESNYKNNTASVVISVKAPSTLFLWIGVIVAICGFILTAVCGFGLTRKTGTAPA
jgi:hypothetical protein